jgi:hypothetical protein
VKQELGIISLGRGERLNLSNQGANRDGAAVGRSIATVDVRTPVASRVVNMWIRKSAKKERDRRALVSYSIFYV